MNNALIVSNSEANTNLLLKKILMEAGIDNVITLRNAGEARRLLIENDFDLCIINTPLPDEFGDDLAITIAEKEISEVFLIVKSEIYDQISIRTENLGIVAIEKPISKTILWNSLKIIMVMHKKYKVVQKENKKLCKKIEDIKIVDRAKCTLISHLSMTETQAHKYIEKQAMDLRTSRKDVAEKILKTYTN